VRHKDGVLQEVAGRLVSNAQRAALHNLVLRDVVAPCVNQLLQANRAAGGANQTAFGSERALRLKTQL
jgi:hypothetical protein